MTDATMLARYQPRLLLEWPPPSWQQVVAGLPILPNDLLAFSIAVLPAYTFSVVLLDTALAVPNVVVGGFITICLAAFMWFLNRNQSATDAANKETKEAVQALTALVTEMRMERKEDRLLTSYLKERQDALETENKSLRTSVQAFDTYLAVQVATKKNTP